MTLPIYSLENHIPDKIFKRGIDYQSRGLVEDFTEKGAGIWTAFVLGSDEYRVSITKKMDCLLILAVIVHSKSWKYVSILLLLYKSIFSVQHQMLTGPKRKNKRND